MFTKITTEMKHLLTHVEANTILTDLQHVLGQVEAVSPNVLQSYKTEVLILIMNVNWQDSLDMEYHTDEVPHIIRK